MQVALISEGGVITVPCCIIAAALIVRFMIRWQEIKAYLGFEVTDDNPYGWEEYCELDEYAN